MTLGSALLSATLLPLCLTQSAQAVELTTLFAANNGGNNGGAVYFNLQTGSSNISITGLTTNTADVSGPTDGFQVYTKLGTAQGSETSLGEWTLAATGTITPSGTNNPSPVSLASSISLLPNTLYGLALIMPSTVGHNYTNGTCASSYTIGGNCSFADANLTFIGGSASSVPFTAPTFPSRIWNGSITYNATAVPLETDALPLVFSGLFVGGGVWFKRKRNQAKVCELIASK